MVPRPRDGLMMPHRAGRGPARIALFAILCVALVTWAAGAVPAPDVPNFHQVSRYLYRGGQPGSGAIDDLAGMGIRSIINLRPDGDEIAQEREEAEASGLAYYHVPMRPFGRPRDEEVRRVLDLTGTAGNQPVFVHCSRGADRTGTTIACYRIRHEGWTADEALAEAKSLGLGWWQFGMKRYIKQSCGMETP